MAFGTHGALATVQTSKGFIKTSKRASPWQIFKSYTPTAISGSGEESTRCGPTCLQQSTAREASSKSQQQSTGEPPVWGSQEEYLRPFPMPTSWKLLLLKAKFGGTTTREKTSSSSTISTVESNTPICSVFSTDIECSFPQKEPTLGKAGPRCSLPATNRLKSGTRTPRDGQLWREDWTLWKK